MKHSKYHIAHGAFPQVRLRRGRRHPWSRALLAEHRLTVHDLVWPVFVQEGKGQRSEVASMPGVHRLSTDLLIEKIRHARDLGIPAVAVFPVVDPQRKTEQAEESYSPDNLVCRAIKEIKSAVPEIGLVCDVALDPYTSHGQDGLVIQGEVDNDATLDVLCRQAVAQAAAGCDIVAPSDMMDGRVGAIRRALDGAGFSQVSILSYAAKYASSFYGPFRDAVGSAAALGGADKRSYQMDPANGDEALREVGLDVFEGADMVMVKPGMPYLDVIRRVHEAFSVPVFAYQVSGEYAMIKAAAKEGWLREEDVMMESLVAFKRAGATGIFTYAAIEVAERLG